MQGLGPLLAEVPPAYAGVLFLGSSPAVPVFLGSLQRLCQGHLLPCSRRTAAKWMQEAVFAVGPDAVAFLSVAAACPCPSSAEASLSVAAASLQRLNARAGAKSY